MLKNHIIIYNADNFNLINSIEGSTSIILFFKLLLEDIQIFWMNMPNKISILIEDAIFAFSIGEDEKAEKILLGVVDENKNCLEAYRALAEVSLTLDKLQQAEEACRSALQINSEDLTSVVSLARILVRRGDKDGAEEASAKARILGWKEELAEDEVSE